MVQPYFIFMHNYLAIILFASVAYLSFMNFMPAGQVNNEAVQNKDSLVTITVSVVGDLMCHSTQYNYARVSADSFDFRPVYRMVEKYFKESNFNFGNLETVTAGSARGFSGYPFFNTPDEYITALSYAGFDLITTANNHSLDKGEHGLLRTLEQLVKNNLHYNGTYTSQRDRDSVRLFNVNGIKLAFLAYTYGTNGIPVPAGKDYLINLIDHDLIEMDIQSVRRAGAEIVIFHFHFGDEYKREPNNYQKEVVQKSINAGADIIIGGHPHVLQPVEFFKGINSTLDSGFVAYSLGNFISNQQWRYSDAGAILSFSITKDFYKDSVWVEAVEFIPTWVFRGNTEMGREYIILPAELYYDESNFQFLSSMQRSLMKQAFEDSKEILTRYDKRPRLRSVTGDFQTISTTK